MLFLFCLDVIVAHVPETIDTEATVHHIGTNMADDIQGIVLFRHFTKNMNQYTLV